MLRIGLSRIDPSLHNKANSQDSSQGQGIKEKLCSK